MATTKVEVGGYLTQTQIKQTIKKIEVVGLILPPVLLVRVV